MLWQPWHLPRVRFRPCEEPIKPGLQGRKEYGAYIGARAPIRPPGTGFVGTGQWPRADSISTSRPHTIRTEAFCTAPCDDRVATGHPRLKHAWLKPSLTLGQSIAMTGTLGWSPLRPLAICYCLTSLVPGPPEPTVIKALVPDHVICPGDGLARSMKTTSRSTASIIPLPTTALAAT
jgi:hypothetical protein